MRLTLANNNYPIKTMKLKNYTFLLFFITVSCTSSTGEKDNNKEESKEEVTYQEVVKTVYDNAGERIEWHGEAIDISAKPSLELYLNGPCRQKDCGEKYFVKNNDSTRTVEIVVNSKFLIKDQLDVGHVRKYTLEAGAEQFVGCSEFCHALESFKITNEVVGAKFL